MARLVVVVFALLLFAVVGFSYASESPAPSGNHELPQEPPNSHIGTTSDSDSPSTVKGAPIGGPVPPGAFSSTDAHNAASAVPTAATAALAAFFFNLVHVF